MGPETLPVQEQPDLCRNLLTSFGGVPAGQIWADFYLWEMLLNDKPDLRGIVEVGTWKGGFSRYLYAQAEARGIGFVTFDAVRPPLIPQGFQRADVFAEPGVVVSALARFEPAILLCDGGNKPREIKMFAPFVPRDGLLVVHDWMTEVGPDDVPDTLVEVCGELCDTLGSMSRVFEQAPA